MKLISQDSFENTLFQQHAIKILQDAKVNVQEYLQKKENWLVKIPRSVFSPSMIKTHGDAKVLEIEIPVVLLPKTLSDKEIRSILMHCSYLSNLSKLQDRAIQINYRKNEILIR